MSKLSDNQTDLLTNADTRVVVRWMLERWGCRVVEAADGREALERTV